MTSLILVGKHWKYEKNPTLPTVFALANSPLGICIPT